MNLQQEQEGAKWIKQIEDRTVFISSCLFSLPSVSITLKRTRKISKYTFGKEQLCHLSDTCGLFLMRSGTVCVLPSFTLFVKHVKNG